MKTEDILQEGAVADVATAVANPAATGSVEEAPGETGGEAAYGGRGGEAARLRLAPPDSLRRGAGAGEAGVAETKGGAGIRESETGDTARLRLATVAGEEGGSGAEAADGTGAAEAGAKAEADAGGAPAEAAETMAAGTGAGIPAGEAGIPAAEVERLVDEAYRRGRNESIAELMARPGMLQPAGARSGDAAAGAETGFLANRRPSIWDR